MKKLLIHKGYPFTVRNLSTIRRAFSARRRTVRIVQICSSLFLFCIPTLCAATLETSVSLNATRALSNGYCESTGSAQASCSLDTLEPVIDLDGIEPATGLVTATASPDLLTVTAKTLIDGGEDGGGRASVAGAEHILYGGFGAGYAEMLVRWNLDLFGAWGTPGPYAQFPGTTLNWASPVSGTAWSAPISMTWGKPFTYDMVLGGGFFNGQGDCCGGLDLSLEILDWRGFDDQMNPVARTESSRMVIEGGGLSFAPTSAVPEPNTLGIMIAFTLVILFRSATRARRTSSRPSERP